MRPTTRHLFGASYFAELIAMRTQADHIVGVILILITMILHARRTAGAGRMPPPMTFVCVGSATPVDVSW
jgi:hypothetical protein